MMVDGIELKIRIKPRELMDLQFVESNNEWVLVLPNKWKIYFNSNKLMAQGPSWKTSTIHGDPLCDYDELISFIIDIGIK